VLYANKSVASFLRNNFILHWKSVRPVPRITVDFGDGRVIEQTITGNAAHYVLDSSGRLIDAIPGIYGPKAFQNVLQPTLAVWRTFDKATGANRLRLLANHHRRQLQKLQRDWAKDLQTIETRTARRKRNAARNLPISNDKAVSNELQLLLNRELETASAREATAVTTSKSGIELRLVEQVMPSILPKDADDEMWKKIALLHSGKSYLDSSTRKLIALQNPALDATRRTMGKRLVETPLLRMLRSLQRSLAVDTVRNEYEFHQRIHEWFIAGAGKMKLADFNERVYAKIFLTPSNDPWLGLRTKDAYTGLLNNGLHR